MSQLTVPILQEKSRAPQTLRGYSRPRMALPFALKVSESYPGRFTKVCPAEWLRIVPDVVVTGSRGRFRRSGQPAPGDVSVQGYFRERYSECEYAQGPHWPLSRPSASAPGNQPRGR